MCNILRAPCLTSFQHIFQKNTSLRERLLLPVPNLERKHICKLFASKCFSLNDLIDQLSEHMASNVQEHLHNAQTEAVQSAQGEAVGVCSSLQIRMKHLTTQGKHNLQLCMDWVRDVARKWNEPMSSIDERNNEYVIPHSHLERETQSVKATLDRSRQETNATFQFLRNSYDVLPACHIKEGVPT